MRETAIWREGADGVVSVQAAITEYSKQGGLNSRTSFLTVLEAEKTQGQGASRCDVW